MEGSDSLSREDLDQQHMHGFPCRKRKTLDALEPGDGQVQGGEEQEGQHMQKASRTDEIAPEDKPDYFPTTRVPRSGWFQPCR